MKIVGFVSHLLALSTSNWFSWLVEVDGLSVYKMSGYENDAVTMKYQIIFPGTKWCGDGNIAKDYNDLGEFKEADKCCRQHDHCPDSISKGQTKHGLTNNCSYTKNKCDCDQVFKDCLSKNDDDTSRTIANIYFNMPSSRCFSKEYPIIKCMKHYKKDPSRCAEYLLDEKKPKIWQWFDLVPNKTKICYSDSDSDSE